MTAHVDKTCAETVYLTPDRVLDPVRHYYSLRPGSGVIDLDPATQPDNPVGAEFFCVARNASIPAGVQNFMHDGLNARWGSIGVDHRNLTNVFVNPPFGAGLKDWTVKINRESRRSRIVALLPGQRFETAYWQRDILDAETLLAIVMIRRRLSFRNAKGEKRRGNTYGSMLYVYDHGPAAWSHVCMAFGHLGKILRITEIGGGDVPVRGEPAWSPARTGAKA